MTEERASGNPYSRKYFAVVLETGDDVQPEESFATADGLMPDVFFLVFLKFLILLHLPIIFIAVIVSI